MCTLSVITRDDGYLVGMNRDEKITRGFGTGPKVHNLRGARAVYPGDGAGGTWIGMNQYAITLALLNWNDVVPGVANKRRSRGQLIPALLGSASLVELQSFLNDSDVKEMSPFRLVGVFASEKVIREWRWDSTRITSLSHGWGMHHWFSSSLSDKQAGSLRGAACHDALHEPDAASVPWLRRLHASHAGGAAFSLCVHRPDVETLSYSEINCTSATVRMKHFIGRPCTMGPLDESQIERSRAVVSQQASGV